jgi:hypothetical protein
MGLVPVVVLRFVDLEYEFQLLKYEGLSRDVTPSF